jgi:hypothetical protein
MNPADDLSLQVDDSQLECAILRPMKSGHDTFLAYYLADGVDSAEKLQTMRATLQPYQVPDTDEVSPSSDSLRCHVLIYVFLPSRKLHSDLFVIMRRLKWNKKSRMSSCWS